MERLAKAFAATVGVVFMALGVLGFVPGATEDYALVYFFATDPVMNVLHLAVGIVAIVAIYEYQTDAFCRWAGVSLLLIGLLGFAPVVTTADGALLGFIQVNWAVNLLHVAAGAAGAVLGFAPRFGGRTSSAH